MVNVDSMAASNDYLVACFASVLKSRNLGTATALIMLMRAITTINSINVKPETFFADDFFGYILNSKFLLQNSIL